jgi:argonaute-like protein implicated in RNA metabolism and viral defense
VPTNGRNQVFTQGMVRKFRMRGIEFVRAPVTFGTHRAQNYKSAALDAARQNVDAALVVVAEDDRKLFGADSPYLVSKATLMSQGIPAQMVRIQTVMQRNVGYSLNNIALALYAKLNGIPWTLSVQQRLTHEIIVGIGSGRVGADRLGEHERLIGITTVFSGDGNYLLGNATAEVVAEGYQRALLTSLESTIAELRRRFGWQRGDKLRVIFHQSFKRYKDAEAAAVRELVGQLTDFEVEYAFVTVGDDHDWKLFDPAEKGIQNLGPGPRKGAGVPARGQIVPLGPYAALLTLTGPRQLKTELQGGPRPLLVAIHRESTFKSLDYIAKQVFDLSFMSWRTFMPTTRPVSIAYPNMVVKLLGDLREIPNWNPDILTTRLRESRWFL